MFCHAKIRASMTGPDYIVDIDGLKPAEDENSGTGARNRTLKGRPWLAVYWKCCQVYSRIYRNKKGDAYEGRCPKCNRFVRAAIGPDGTDARFFEAY